MKFLKSLLAAALVVVFAAALPAPARASTTISTIRTPAGGTTKYTPTGPGGWELLATGTDAGTALTNDVLTASALYTGYTGLRATMACTFTGAASGRVGLYIFETDSLGNQLENNNETGADNYVDTGVNLNGTNGIAIILEMVPGDYNTASASSWDNVRRTGRLPPPYWSLVFSRVAGTYTTLSCYWEIYGWRS